MEKDARIYVAGHRGLVGSAIVKRLQAEGYYNLVCQNHQELDLCRQDSVEKFFRQTKPEYVLMAAAKVGGILANSAYPADFIYQNILIQSNIIHAAYMCGVKKLLFLGSSCIYPRLCPQPMKEEHLLTGALESTNEPYAVAKIAGIKMCQAYNKQYGTCFIAAMPTNLYGPGDHFDLEASHVIPALIRKFHEAKVRALQKNHSDNIDPVIILGTGTPLREFLHVDDLADACVFLMNHYQESNIINIGVGKEISIQALALLIKKITGFAGALKFDPSKPDGTPRKLLDVQRLTSLGWQAKIPLREGLESTYRWYQEQSPAAL
jgi:GDP-L-fucose synthase